MMMYNMMPRPEMVADRMLRSMCGAAPRHGGPRSFFPVDVKKEDDAFILTAELPGVKQEDIDVTVENDVLTIAARVQLHQKEDRAGYVILERRGGCMERRFQLEGVRQADITATSENGVLTVVLPRVAPEDGKSLRRIAIGGTAPALEAPAE